MQELAQLQTAFSNTSAPEEKLAIVRQVRAILEKAPREAGRAMAGWRRGGNVGEIQLYLLVKWSATPPPEIHRRLAELVKIRQPLTDEERVELTVSILGYSDSLVDQNGNKIQLLFEPFKSLNSFIIWAEALSSLLDDCRPDESEAVESRLVRELDANELISALDSDDHLKRPDRKKWPSVLRSYTGWHDRVKKCISPQLVELLLAARVEWTDISGDLRQSLSTPEDGKDDEKGVKLAEILLNPAAELDPDALRGWLSMLKYDTSGRKEIRDYLKFYVMDYDWELSKVAAETFGSQAYEHSSYLYDMLDRLALEQIKNWQPPRDKVQSNKTWKEIIALLQQAKHFKDLDQDLLGSLSSSLVKYLLETILRIDTRKERHYFHAWCAFAAHVRDGDAVQEERYTDSPILAQIIHELEEGELDWKLKNDDDVAASCFIQGMKLLTPHLKYETGIRIICDSLASAKKKNMPFSISASAEFLLEMTDRFPESIDISHWITEFSKGLRSPGKGVTDHLNMLDSLAQVLTSVKAILSEKKEKPTEEILRNVFGLLDDSLWQTVCYPTILLEALDEWFDKDPIDSSLLPVLDGLWAEKMSCLQSAPNGRNASTYWEFFHDSALARDVSSLSSLGLFPGKNLSDTEDREIGRVGYLLEIMKMIDTKEEWFLLEKKEKADILWQIGGCLESIFARYQDGKYTTQADQISRILENAWDQVETVSGNMSQKDRWVINILTRVEEYEPVTPRYIAHQFSQISDQEVMLGLMERSKVTSLANELAAFLEKQLLKLLKRNKNGEKDEDDIICFLNRVLSRSPNRKIFERLEDNSEDRNEPIHKLARIILDFMPPLDQVLTEKNLEDTVTSYEKLYIDLQCLFRDKDVAIKSPYLERAAKAAKKIRGLYNIELPERLENFVDTLKDQFSAGNQEQNEDPGDLFWLNWKVDEERWMRAIQPELALLLPHIDDLKNRLIDTSIELVHSRHILLQDLSKALARLRDLIRDPLPYQEDMVLGKILEESISILREEARKAEELFIESQRIGEYIRDRKEEESDRLIERYRSVKIHNLLISFYRKIFHEFGQSLDLHDEEDIFNYLTRQAKKDLKDLPEEYRTELRELLVESLDLHITSLLETNREDRVVRAIFTAGKDDDRLVLQETTELAGQNQDLKDRLTAIRDRCFDWFNERYNLKQARRILRRVPIGEKYNRIRGTLIVAHSPLLMCILAGCFLMLDVGDKLDNPGLDPYMIILYYLVLFGPLFILTNLYFYNHLRELIKKPFLRSFVITIGSLFMAIALSFLLLIIQMKEISLELYIKLPIWGSVSLFAGVFLNALMNGTDLVRRLAGGRGRYPTAS